MPTLVAVCMFACSSHAHAGDEIAGAASQLAQKGVDQSLDLAQPTPRLEEQGSTVLPDAGTSERAWAEIIHDLMSDPARTELAADVGELLRQGDMARARQMLNAAISLGTFAIITDDKILDPELQKLLQAIARERQATRLAQGLPADEDRANRNNPDEAGGAVEREWIRAEAALQELHAMQGELAALREKEARVAELEHVLEQEKGRTASAIQDLSLVREQLAAMTRNATRAADTIVEHAREVERGKAAVSALTTELTEAQEQLAVLKGSTEEAAELRLVLERERDAAKIAAREIEPLRRELFTLETSEISSTGAVSLNAQENERGDDKSHQLKAVQEQLSALRGGEARMRGELEQERGRSASAVRQLEASQRETLALKAQATSTVTFQEALRNEKENTAAALRDVRALMQQIAELGARREFVPAALLFQTTPVLLKSSTRTFRSGAGANSGAGTDGDISQRKARRGSLPSEIERERILSDEATAQSRHSNSQLKSVEKLDRQPPASSKPSEAAGRDTVVKLKRSPRLPARGSSAPEPIAPDLPAVLLPVDGLWALY